MTQRQRSSYSVAPWLRAVAFLIIPATVSLVSAADTGALDISGWDARFAFHYDYVLKETAGLDRLNEPVEVTLTVPGAPPEEWQAAVRVVRLTEDQRGMLVPHQVLGAVSAIPDAAADGKTPNPASSVNVVFLADCAAKGEVTYRLFWGVATSGTQEKDAPQQAAVEDGLDVVGDPPGLTIGNRYYTVELDPKSGAIRTARLADLGEDTRMFYKTVPIHFGTDVWSPGQSWDHDYDWKTPPNQKPEGGALAMRYHRWGPLQTYRDVIVSITYTFYTHVPHIHVSSTMQFTENRSAHAVRMGEIVVSHSKKPHPNEGEEIGPDIFTHFAWPGDGDQVVAREINACRADDGRANVEGVVPGALGILDRDIPWVAGYNVAKGYGMASLRKAQFVGNRQGGATPHAVSCTYVANYGWGFAYWSRPMVYPLGARETPLDQNTAIAAGALFATEEALLFFKPDPDLSAVRAADRRFLEPLRLQFKGTGPW